jgi:hypothetical protein
VQRLFDIDRWFVGAAHFERAVITRTTGTSFVIRKPQS